MGVDVLGLPYVVMLTETDVPDRDEAIRMISRYCDASDYLDLLKKILANGGYTSESSRKQSNLSPARKRSCKAE